MQKPKPKGPPSPYEVLKILFLRRYDRPLSAVAKVGMDQPAGAAWRVVIHTGDRDCIDGRTWELAREHGLVDQPVITREATGASPEEAIRKLLITLAKELTLRIRSDIGALELAGLPFDMVKGEIIDTECETERGPIVIDVEAEPPLLPR